MADEQQSLRTFRVTVTRTVTYEATVVAATAAEAAVVLGDRVRVWAVRQPPVAGLGEAAVVVDVLSDVRARRVG